ncbi:MULTISPECIES: hypothetical protein [Gammaproteobacteria]|uniref:hypothetical protein n=1 Tax=Gammaproteobacteria TaxID=1236 RepID=UPI001ADAB7DF|nr:MULTISPECIES: hypothetical protein [Gammaproteobacteria]MBO9482148.1 hypothetical protein [Salinisphaera sp. G21_0]MBO9494622.1 hypothetical protein [Thalassotalea sp. G20_0]
MAGSSPLAENWLRIGFDYFSADVHQRNVNFYSPGMPYFIPYLGIHLPGYLIISTHSLFSDLFQSLILQSLRTFPDYLLSNAVCFSFLRQQKKS